MILAVDAMNLRVSAKDPGRTTCSFSNRYRRPTAVPRSNFTKVERKWTRPVQGDSATSSIASQPVSLLPLGPSWDSRTTRQKMRVSNQLCPGTESRGKLASVWFRESVSIQGTSCTENFLHSGKSGECETKKMEIFCHRQPAPSFRTIVFGALAVENATAGWPAKRGVSDSV